MNRITDLSTLHGELKRTKTGVAGDTILTTKAEVVYLVDLVEELVRLTKRQKVQRAMSPWQVFVSEYAKQGKGIFEAAKDWKNRND